MRSQKIIKLVFFLGFCFSLFLNLTKITSFFAEAQISNLTPVNVNYQNLNDWITNRIKAAYENGTEFYAYNRKLSLEMEPNGLVKVKTITASVNENTSKQNFFS